MLVSDLCPSAPIAAIVWSRRSPPPEISTNWAGLSSTAIPIANSVSVSSLSGLWRLIAECCSAQASPADDTESRSPTSSDGDSPAASA